MVGYKSYTKSIIPSMNPFSGTYKEFWKTEKRKCIEGVWMEGKYMPGILYFFLNYWTIELNKTATAKVKSLGQPFLRDLEWERAYYTIEARGFSGFADDKEVTCHRGANIETYNPESWNVLPSECFKVDGSLKRFVPAREYLFKRHTQNLGKALFHNEAMNVIDIEARGGGKQLPHSEVVMTPSGPSTMGNIKVGDKVLGKDGLPTTVQKVFPQGLDDVYKITLQDSREVRCGLEHQWEVFHGKNKRVLTTEDMLNKGYYNIHTQNTGKTFKYKIENCAPIKYKEKVLSVDPYILGALLGDGTMTTNTLKIASSDIFILREFERILGSDYILKHDQSTTNNHTITYVGKNRFIKDHPYGHNPFTTKIKELKVDKKCSEKFIPKVYMQGSITQRIHLLQGLLDTDGSINGYGSIEFTNTNKNLALQVKELAQSLGIQARWGIDDRTNQTHSIKGHKCSRPLTYRVYLKTGLSVFRLPRKLARVTPLKRLNRVSIVNIEKLNYQEESSCIMVDNHDNTFLTTDYVVTHNSFWMSCTVAHNFLFDGALDYDELLREKFSSETLVGAIDSFYSSSLLSKVQLGLNNLRGDMDYAGTKYPSPLSKSYSGSWTSGKHILGEVDVKKGGNWIKQGSRSKIQHRSFKDNPFAANGIRPGWACLEEIGFFDNLLDSLGQLKECTVDGATKFGAIWMSGTGGDMVGGATEAAKEVFYNPEKYDCIAFTDEHEGSPFKIGMFMPAWKTLNQFKDDNGITHKAPALNFLEKAREKLSKGADKKAHNDELQQRPIVPSEAFLLTTGNIFPIADLTEHLKWLETSTDGDVIGQAGRMNLNSDTGTAEFKPYTKKSDPVPCDYPVKKGENSEGAVQIWEHPDENAAYGWYVAGNDPYDLDTAPNSNSLGSIIILKRATVGSGNHDKIVAEYTARPASAKEYYEQARRLLMYFSALCLYENEKIGIKTYFEQKHSLYLLAYTPTILKANQSTKVNRVYGQNMSKTVGKDGKSKGPKAELEVFLRDWLQEPVGEGKMNLHFIYSKPIIKELISYNDTGNYDRIIALMLAVAQREQMYNIAIEEKKEIERDSFFTRTFFQ